MDVNTIIGILSLLVTIVGLALQVIQNKQKIVTTGKV